MKKTLLFSFTMLLALFFSFPSIAQTESTPHMDYIDRDGVVQFIDEMSEQFDYDRGLLYALFHATQPIPAVLKAIRPPADPGIRSWRAYRSRFVEPTRIMAGKQFMQRYASELAVAEARFGVPAEIITAIIGIETIYGQHMGNYTTFAALATLAFDYPPRAELFRRELVELLLLAREENRPVLSYTGSYAGAMGWPQFMPSSVRQYALDFDNDGKVDLAASPVDAIGSAANFLAEHGWRKGGPIAEKITITGDGIQALIDEGIKPQHRPSEFAARDVQIKRVHEKVGAGDTATNDQFSDQLSDQPAALIDLITPDAPTEYRLGYQNFYVITRYNRSSFYAAAVMDLAGTLKATSDF
ncbi:MAG: lytic murein transglycosylase B [Rugosibacter sp.]|nr:lytic murein transglycosylase B [Rugosibacter sp.]